MGTITLHIHDPSAGAVPDTARRVLASWGKGDLHFARYLGVSENSGGQKWAQVRGGGRDWNMPAPRWWTELPEVSL